MGHDSVPRYSCGGPPAGKKGQVISGTPEWLLTAATFRS